MTTIKARGELLDVTDSVNLTIQFKDENGDPVNTDSFPKISIIQPSGLVLLSPTSTGVTQVSTGRYSYIFEIPINGPYGIFNDIWLGYVNGYRVETTFNFIVVGTNVPGINTDGYQKLGEYYPTDYSQIAIANINKLLRSLRARLNSAGKSRKTDAYGNVEYQDCDIFSVDTLVTFLGTALWDFNQVPFFTGFTFDEDDFVNMFGEILIEGATLYALTSKALIERGAEYNMTDNGVAFQPPTVSEMLNTQYTTLLTHYWEKLKMIKNSLRPHPITLGSYSITNSGINPAVRRMRHLRARRIF